MATVRQAAPHAAQLRRQSRASLRVLPVTSAELIRDGVSPQRLRWMALRRASRGGLATSGEHYYDWGRLLPHYLSGIIDELLAAGSLTLAGQNTGTLRRIRITSTGQRQYAQLCPAPEGTFPGPCPPGHRTHHPRASAAVAGPAESTSQDTALHCGSVLAPIPGVHYLCTLPPGHDTGPNPTPCTDLTATITW